MSFACSNRTARPGFGRGAQPNRNGFTLVEMLVAFTLVVLLFGLFIQFLVPALRKSASTSVKAQRQQRATLSLRKLVTEMERTTVAGISVLEDPPTVAVHPIVDVTQNSRRVYADHVVVYQYDRAGQRILRGEWKSGSSPNTMVPKRLTQDELTKATLFFTREPVAVARDISDLDFVHQGTKGFLRLPLQVKMEMQEKDTDGSTKFELVRNVSLRNQL